MMRGTLPMAAPISLEPVLDFFSGDPFDTAVARITRRLDVDQAALKLLRRAASRGGARATSAYAWALGARTGSEALNSPVALADIAADAAALAPDDPAVQAALGLAHAGAFGGRRATPLTARRAFNQAARLDADNAVPHLLSAAARYGTNDEPGAAKAVTAALAATHWTPYRSPLSDELLAEAPWLSWPLAQLWPERADGALRFAADSLLASRRRLDLLRLAHLAVTTGPKRSSNLLHGLGLTGRALSAMAQGDDDPLASRAQPQIAALAARLVEEQRALARRFEEAAGGLVKAAGGGAGAGVVASVVGLLRSRRRWPPPIPFALGVPGRTIGWAGALLTAGSAGLALVDNAAARARRRAVETDLLAAEEAMATDIIEAYRAAVAPLL